MCTLIALPLLGASIFFGSRQGTPLLVITQLFPSMLKSKLFFMVCVEDCVGMFHHIIIILPTGSLSRCSLICSSKLAYYVIDLLPTILAVRWLSFLTASNMSTSREVCCYSFPESIGL